MLTHLALLIDLKEAHLDKTHVPFLRKQLHAELEALCLRFQAEYQEFLNSTVPADAGEKMLTRAA